MKRHDFLATWSSRTGAGWLSPAVDIVHFFALGDKLFSRFVSTDIRNVPIFTTLEMTPFS